MQNLRDRGKGVLLISTDLDEIMQVSDRIAVMYEGKIMGIVENSAELKAETLGLMMGVHRQKRPKPADKKKVSAKGTRAAPKN